MSDLGFAEVNYLYSISSAHPIQPLCDLLLDILSQHARPWWGPLGSSGLLGFEEPGQQKWWDTATAKERAKWLTTQLWTCQDRLPWEFCDILHLPRASTYAQTVRRLWMDLLDSESEPQSVGA